MEDLKNLVKELIDIKESCETGRCQQIKKLQEIAEKILREYYIKIGDITIEPLLIEAYYYHKGKFEDTSVHASKESKANTYELARKRQKNNFGKLYVHYGTKDGIDIVLSLNDEYYLSILIKNALVDSEWATQCAISEKICEKCDNRNECKGLECKYYDEIVLVPVESQNQEIVFFPRKGIKNDFAKEDLAALPIDKIKEHKFTPGKSRTKIVEDYIHKKLSAENLDKKEEQKLKELASGLVAWEKFKGI